LKVRTNLAQPQVTKMLKALEGKSLIKSVKNVNNPSRKLYMLFELEPSREITGGAWCVRMKADQQPAASADACMLEPVNMLLDLS
jgi:DNA-directed RNA polymerase III subunit RPC6